MKWGHVWFHPSAFVMQQSHTSSMQHLIWVNSIKAGQLLRGSDTWNPYWAMLFEPLHNFLIFIAVIIIIIFNSMFLLLLIFYEWLFHFLLCKALWITTVYEMCYINKLALPLCCVTRKRCRWTKCLGSLEPLQRDKHYTRPNYGLSSWPKALRSISFPFI